MVGETVILYRSTEISIYENLVSVVTAPGVSYLMFRGFILTHL